MAGDHLLAFHVEDAVAMGDVVVSMDGGDAVPLFLNPETGFYEWTFATSAEDATGARVYSDGVHTLVFTATDAAGHTTEMTRSLYVDNTGPDIADIKPFGGEVKEQVTFKVVVTDSTDVEDVLIRIGERNWRSMNDRGDGTWTWTWDTVVGDNVEGLKVQFRAVDSLGNEAVDSIDIDVANFNWLPIIILIVVAVLGALLFLMWKKGYIGGDREEEEIEGAPDPVEAELEDMWAESSTPEGQTEEAEVQVDLENGGVR